MSVKELLLVHNPMKSYQPLVPLLRARCGFKWFLTLSTFGLTATQCHAQNASSATDIQIPFVLDKAGYATLVLEDPSGRRVANLTSGKWMKAGSNTVVWDGRDIVRNGAVAAAGEYRLRALTHQGIKTRYEFSVNSPGSPPWKTLDRTGAWLGDHSPPTGAVYLPPTAGAPFAKNQPCVMLSNWVGETADSLIGVDLSGKKLFGGGVDGWFSGLVMARDVGAKSQSSAFVYSVIPGEIPDPKGADDGVFNRYFIWAQPKDGKASSKVAEVLLKNYVPYKTPGMSWHQVALAVHNDIAALATGFDNTLSFVDLKTGATRSKHVFPELRGVAFSSNGTLYVTSKKRILAFQNFDAKSPRLPAPRVVVASGLEEPRQLSLDSKGRLYVSDWGKSHQIKVFSPQGKFVVAVGRAGGRQIGLYDERRMQLPWQVAVTDAGEMWVCEMNSFPKRVSVWKTDGTFVRAYNGPPPYGGGGALDPHDKRRFYHDGVEFKLDWNTGSYKPRSIYWRDPRIEYPNEYPTVDKSIAPLITADIIAGDGPLALPERSITVGKHQYLHAYFNGSLRGDGKGGFLWMMQPNGIALPVAGVNGIEAQDWREGENPFDRADIKKLVPATKDNESVVFAWSDLNLDHFIQGNELQFKVVPGMNHEGAFFGPDLSVTTWIGAGVAAPKIRADGVPIYDLSTWREGPNIVSKKQGYRIPGYDNGDEPSGEYPGATVAGANGWLFANDTPVKTGYQNGRHKWSYLKSGALDGSGNVRWTNRFLGPPFAPKSGQANEIMAINGEQGSVYLMTMDGFYVQALGGDEPDVPRWRMKQHKRGMLIEGVSYEQEHFNPTITQTDDGQVYIVVGKEHSSILRLEGLETVRRLDLKKVIFTVSQAATIQKQVKARNAMPAKILLVAQAKSSVKIDGKFDEWPKPTSWAKIDERASATVMFADGKLYGAFRTGDAKAIQSSGDNFRYLFKSGGALDLMIGKNPRFRKELEFGDLRLLVTINKGKKTAVLFRPRVFGTPIEQRIIYQSPIGQAIFEGVSDVSDQLQLAKSGGDFEYSIPLDALGLSLDGVESMRGDLGVLRGNGVETTQRIYWSNKNTQLVSDVPSQARLEPEKWGEWKIEK